MMFTFLFNNTQAISAGEEIVASEYKLKLASSKASATGTSAEHEETDGFELNRLKLQFSRYGGFIAYGATGFFFTLVTLNQISTLINPASSLLSSGGMPYYFGYCCCFLLVGPEDTVTFTDHLTPLTTH